MPISLDPRRIRIDSFDNFSSNSTCIPMLSSRTPNQILTPGRHQRQNSTPTTFYIQKDISPVTHRRGLSTDQSLYTHQDHGSPHQTSAYEGVEQPLGQKLTQTVTMRETQQQFMARPGLHDSTIYEQLQYTQALTATPSLEHGIELSDKFDIAAETQSDNQTRQSFSEPYNLHEMNFPTFDSTTSAGNLDGFRTGIGGRGNFRSNEIMDRTMMPSGIESTTGSRPTSSGGLQQSCTCSTQMRTIPNFTADVGEARLPMTPGASPFSQNAKIKKIPQNRTVESSPSRRDPGLTIKASHEMQRGTSCQDNFTAMSPAIPSPPNTAPLELHRSTDVAPFPEPRLFSMASLTNVMPPWEGGYNASNYSPLSNAVSSTASSFQSSPEITHMSLFEIQDTTARDELQTSNSPILPASQSTVDLGNHSSPDNESLQPRSQSMSQVEDVNECIEETGVTSDEIAAFISLCAADNKWMCLYPNCEKKSPRKENIKAHVQTHLDDRQFRCKDCNKRFVRQHDLKRHLNIHSRKRTYLCPCSRTFARHDALTRHRQRGCCIGAFEGATKKIMKRGRPKKPRPEAEDRMEKSAATRQRALEKLEKRSPGKYASSVSGSSVSTYPSPEFFESPFEQASSPPELDLCSSSPTASKSLGSEPTLSQTIPFGLGSNTDLCDPDFDLSASLSKYTEQRDANEPFFQDYLHGEIEDAATFNDFDFPNDM
ncbi:Metallothionein expression activator [Lecanora helva]